MSFTAISLCDFLDRLAETRESSFSHFAVECVQSLDMPVDKSILFGKGYAAETKSQINNTSELNPETKLY